MNEKIRKIIDDLYRATNEAGMTLEEIQEEIVMTFEQRAEMEDEEIQENRIAAEELEEDFEFEKKVNEFVDMLTFFGNEKTQKLSRQRTIDVICIFHKMRRKNPNLTAQMLTEMCCNKWKCSENVARKQICSDKKRFVRWNKSNHDPLEVGWLYADGRHERGKTEYVLPIIEKFVSNISV